MKNIKKNIIFFDLDGTLHQEDMFTLYILYMIKLHPFNFLLLILLLPIILLGTIIQGRKAIWPINILLWSTTFGYSKKKLLIHEKKFTYWFRKKVTSFPIIQKRLLEHLKERNTEVWIITGTPKSLVEQVYHDYYFLPKVKLMGSKMQRNFCGNILTNRCFGNEKVNQLQKKLGIPLYLHSGYSDSKHDNYLLSYCKNRWRVTRNGNLKKIL